MQGIIATQPVEYPDMVGQLSDLLVLLRYIGVRSRTLQSGDLGPCRVREARRKGHRNP
jgi:hypothetical protein